MLGNAASSLMSNCTYHPSMASNSISAPLGPSKISSANREESHIQKSLLRGKECCGKNSDIMTNRVKSLMNQHACRCNQSVLCMLIHQCYVVCRCITLLWEILFSYFRECDCIVWSTMLGTCIEYIIWVLFNEYTKHEEKIYIHPGEAVYVWDAKAR